MLKCLLAALTGILSVSVHASNLVRLDVEQQADSYTVYVVMDLDAPAEKVRAVLTDYAHLDRLNASITASKIIDAGGDGTVRVLTRFENCIVFFCVTLQRVEDITQDFQGRIQVAMVPELSSFRSGQASWEVMSTGSGSRVIHRATLEPDFWLPPWIGTAILKTTLRHEIRASFENLECLARADTLPRSSSQAAVAVEHHLTVSRAVTRAVDSRIRDDDAPSRQDLPNAGSGPSSTAAEQGVNHSAAASVCRSHAPAAG